MARTPARDLASALLVALGILSTLIQGELIPLAHALALQALAAATVLAWYLDVRANVGRGRRVRGLRRTAAALVVAFLASAPSDAVLEQRGERIRAAIVGHEARYWSLPTSLEALDVANPRTRFGRWNYERAADGADFRLSLGVYDRDTFSLELARSGPPRWDR